MGHKVFIDSGHAPKKKKNPPTILIIFIISNFYNWTTFLAVPDRLFEMLKGERVTKFMKACKEINIAFIPYEEQVITINRLLLFEIIILCCGWIRNVQLFFGVIATKLSGFLLKENCGQWSSY